jgi:hypothetical protein
MCKLNKSMCTSARCVWLVAGTREPGPCYYFPEGPGNYGQYKNKRYHVAPESTLVLLSVGDVLFRLSAADSNKDNGNDHSHGVLNHKEAEEFILHNTYAFRHTCSEDAVAAYQPLVQAYQQLDVRGDHQEQAQFLITIGERLVAAHARKAFNDSNYQQQ